MNHYERLQAIRRANQQAPLKLIEALRAEGMWLKVTFHEDGRIYTVEEVDPVPACFEPTPGVSVLGPIPYQPAPVEPGRVLQ